MPLGSLATTPEIKKCLPALGGGREEEGEEIGRKRGRRQGGRRAGGREEEGGEAGRKKGRKMLSIHYQERKK